MVPQKHRLPDGNAGVGAVQLLETVIATVSSVKKTLRRRVSRVRFSPTVERSLVFWILGLGTSLFFAAYS